MGKTQEDRRSERTRVLLRDALLGLMLEKRFDRITVQDIIDRANVGRSTFYLHYEDKQDLVMRTFEQLFVMLRHQADASNDDGRIVYPTLELFRHVKAQHRLYEALVWGRSVDLFFKAGQQFLSQDIQEHLSASLPAERKPQVPLPVVSSFIAGTLLTLLKWWLDNKMPYPPEQIDEMFQRLVTPGVNAALNVTTAGDS